MKLHEATYIFAMSKASFKIPLYINKAYNERWDLSRMKSRPVARHKISGCKFFCCSKMHFKSINMLKFPTAA